MKRREEHVRKVRMGSAKADDIKKREWVKDTLEILSRVTSCRYNFKHTNKCCE